MDYLSVKDVAALVRCNEETIRRKIRQQKLEADLKSRRQGYMIPVWQLLSAFGVSQQDIDDFIEQLKSEQACEQAAEATRRALSELTQVQRRQQELIHQAALAASKLRQARNESDIISAPHETSEITHKSIAELSPEQQIVVLESQVSELTAQINALNDKLNKK